MRPNSVFRCKDCGERDIGFFMVHDHLWQTAGLHPRDFICQPCFEHRIGRPLSHDDLTLCPGNFMWVEGFATDENYRKAYSADGLNYDKTKADYFDRCARLGVEPNWVTAEVQIMRTRQKL